MQATDAAVFSGLSDGEASDGTEQWIVRQLALVQSGEALDTAAYRMTAEIAVTDAVLQPLLGQLDALDEAAPEAETGVTLAVMQAGDEGLQELDSATISAEEAGAVLRVYPAVCHKWRKRADGLRYQRRSAPHKWRNQRNQIDLSDADRPEHNEECRKRNAELSRCNHQRTDEDVRRQRI